MAKTFIIYIFLCLCKKKEKKDAHMKKENKSDRNKKSPYSTRLG